jgi:hypothetical protein
MRDTAMPDDVCREAVGVFHDEKSLQSAVDELLLAGFDRSHISVLAGQRAVEEKLGRLYTRVDELEDDPTVPTRPHVSCDSRAEGKAALTGGLIYVGAVAAGGAIILSGGTVAAGIIAAALAGGTGGAIGAYLGRLFERRHSRTLHEQLEHGGILLWVRTRDPRCEALAVDILRRNGAEDVHVHDLPELRHVPTDGGVSKELSFMQSLGM